MKKKVLAMILAALMVSVMMAVPASADTTTAVPAGTDLFADKNPGLENTEEEGTGGWESSSVWNCLAEHDTADANYDSALGAQYLHFGTDGTAGTTGPFFDGLEGGRHYYLSFYIRGSEKRDDGQIVISYRKNRGDYHQMTDLQYKWGKLTEFVGIIPATEADSLKWTKLTYDILVPPNADGIKFTLFLKNGQDLDADNFSLIAGEEYISDNMLKNGGFDSIRGDLDPMYWNCDKVYTGSQTPEDGNGGYYCNILRQGALVQSVWLEGGKQYKATFKFRSNSGIRPSGIGIDGTYYCSIDRNADKGVRSTRNDGWEQFTVYFTAPGTAGTFSSRTFAVGYAPANVYGNGGVGIDDVVLTEVENTGISYVQDIPGDLFYQKGYDIYYQNPYVDAAGGLLWWRGTEEDAITDFAAANGVHPVTVNGYHFPKTAGEKISLISAVYKENDGAKQLVSVKVTEVTAADTNPVALTHTIDVKEADASSAWVESFVWTNITKLAPIANSVYTLGK